jgi:hypothetical protein
LAEELAEELMAELADEELRVALDGAVADPAWLADAVHRVSVSPAAIGTLFPAVSRCCGRGPLPGSHPGLAGWTVDDAGRALLLAALPLRGPELAAEAGLLYRCGDAAEKRGVLRALPWLDIGAGGVELLHDAIRSNDPRLVAAALGPYAAHLADPLWRQAVLKCVFMGIPLSQVSGLAGRGDGELGRMLADLAGERRAAGRTMPADADALLAQLTDAEGAG